MYDEQFTNYFTDNHFTTQIQCKLKIGVLIIIIVHRWGRVGIGGWSRTFAIKFNIKKHLLDFHLCDGLLSRSKATKCGSNLLSVVTFLIQIVSPSLLAILK